MKKMNFYVNAGLLMISIALIAKYTIGISEFMSGFLLGLGVTFQLVGMISMRFNIDLCKFKRNLFKRTN